jgi:hypothetical protein
MQEFQQTQAHNPLPKRESAVKRFTVTETYLW